MENKYCYVIMVEHIPTDKVYVSGEGYSTPQKARDFMVKERHCKLYEDYSMQKETEWGWYGKPTDDDEHLYYIREIKIK